MRYLVNYLRGPVCYESAGFFASEAEAETDIQAHQLPPQGQAVILEILEWDQSGPSRSREVVRLRPPDA